MPFIVGTAGHIDHGKTSLVKALTGQDTDRLKEEKERGISIDLGFAHLDLPDGTRAGVIDVPGHERFIRNMLAGAHGIDLVLFLVAADDGVMPQTVEHLDILHLLGVRHAIVVLTKIDLATPARRADVEDEIRTLIAGTSLDGAPIVEFSSVTGEGLDRLRLEIQRSLGAIDRTPPPGYFRLPVDRVFHLQGHGVVVTGTALQGEVQVGDRLGCLPGDQTFRVRSLQVHGQAVSQATWGQRIALNLTGPDTPSITRGHVLCHERLTIATDRFDASFEVRPSAPAGIKNHQRVRVHIGTAERLGKITLLPHRDVAEPGHTGFCQITLSEPVAALRGDRFVVRDETAQHTLGGGIVIHPLAASHGRRERALADDLQTLAAGTPASVTRLVVDRHEDFAMPLAPLHQLLNLREEAALAVVRATPGVRSVGLEGEELFTTDRKWTALQTSILESLRTFHAANPLLPGRDMEELRDKASGRISPRLFRAIVDRLEADGIVRREGSLLRLPGHVVALPKQEQQTAERIRQLLGATPFTPPVLSEIEKAAGIGRATLIQVMRVLERARSVVRVSDDLYFLRDTMDEIAATLRAEFSERDEISPARFRDRFKTSRKYAIPLLEHLDREGVTVRTGDTRHIKSTRPAARP